MSKVIKNAKLLREPSTFEFPQTYIFFLNINRHYVIDIVYDSYDQNTVNYYHWKNNKSFVSTVKNQFKHEINDFCG